ncbi:MAG: hypothetical protein IJ121_04945 [Eubacterium sp.]|nr:hypothetical protein [Eubacterium sp.]
MGTFLLDSFSLIIGSHQYPDVFGYHRMDYNEEDEYFVKTSKNLQENRKMPMFSKSW